MPGFIERKAVEFVETTMPRNTAEIVIRCCRQAFYLGAMAQSEVIFEYLERHPEAECPEWLSVLMASCAVECRDFSAAQVLQLKRERTN